MTASGTRASLCGRRVLACAWLAMLFAFGTADARDAIRIEIDGVDRAMADNIRSYLSLGRYVQRTDLTDPQVRRLADRAVDEAADAMRPSDITTPRCAAAPCATTAPGS